MCLEAQLNHTSENLKRVSIFLNTSSHSNRTVTMYNTYMIVFTHLWIFIFHYLKNFTEHVSLWHTLPVGEYYFYEYQGIHLAQYMWLSEQKPNMFTLKMKFILLPQLIATLNNYACALPPLANVDWSAFPECFLPTM